MSRRSNFPAWMDDALCATRGPYLYELEPFTGDRDGLARGLCVGCPVVRPCAADALEPLAVGTVRGGVWVSDKSTSRARVRRRLAAVARHGLGIL